MKKASRLFVISILISLFTNISSYAQDVVWENYTCGNRIQAIEEDSEFMWIGTEGGLVRINKDTYNTTFYNKSNSGLPYNRVTSIAIDIHGNKWIGTPNGLAKFDGKDWVVYNSSNSELLYNNISAIAADKQGNVWVGTFTTKTISGVFTYIHNLARYDGSDWKIGFGINGNQKIKTMNPIVIDDNDNLWIGTNIGIFDGSMYAKFDEKNSKLPDNSIIAIAIDDDNNIWIATSKGLAKYDGSDLIVYSSSNLKLGGSITSIDIDVNGDKWIGTRGDNGGLYKFDDSVMIHYDMSNSGLNSNNVVAVTVDENGNKWVGTDVDSIMIFDGYNWDSYSVSNSGFLCNQVSSIAIDSTGDKWFTYGSSNKLGVSKYDGTEWIVYNTENSGLLSDKVIFVKIDKNGDKWFLTVRGIIQYDGNVWTDYIDIPIDNFVNTFAFDKDNNLWVGTKREGVFKFDNEVWTSYKTSNSGLPSNEITSIAIDENDNKWIGTSSGFVKFDNETWANYDTLKTAIIKTVIIDKANNKWVVLSNGGFAKFDNSNWIMYDSSNSGLPHNNITAIAVDNSGSVWLGIIEEAYIGGIVKFDGSSWTYYSLANSGLSYYGANSIAIDNNDDKWIGTSWGGVCVLKSKTNSIEELKIEKNIFSQSSPNPFSQSTTINYELQESAHVNITIYDVQGNEIMTLIDEYQTVGEHSAVWSGKDNFKRFRNSAVYYYRLKIGNDVSTTNKLLLLK